MSSPDDRTDSSELLPPGTHVSHYVIQEMLGVGGMGMVFLARDDSLDRTVALKFLPLRFCRDEQSLARFRLEALTVARLNHPNIVTIHEIGEHGVQPFIAMEFIDGRSLADHCGQQLIPLEQMLELAIQVSEGLHEAHHRGIVHQDLKPSNIMVNSRGGVKILDFGLARFMNRNYGESQSIQGTVQYMSPEQLKGEVIDARSDLFSLGIVLYEVFAGRNPFQKEDFRSTIRAIHDSDPEPLSDISPGTPIELQHIVDKLLAKEPGNRYQNAEDVRLDLRYAREAVISGRIQSATAKKGYLRSIAVLPFANLSSDPQQSYLCEGMAEQIISALSRVHGLSVAARVSSFAFKNTNESAREIGRKLHVETLLEGSVQQSGDHLRIGVQLVDVATGYHLWSEQYDDKLKDVFVVQDDITRSVVTSLRLWLAEEALSPGQIATTDPRAYDFYLKGRQYFNQQRRVSLRFALQMFRKAVDIDGNFALANAGIAECCALLVHFYGESSENHLEQADRASLRALELNPRLPEAHAARGFTLWLLNHFDEAWREFDTAISLDPNQAETLYLYGRACFQRGDLTKAAYLFERACNVREHHEARYFSAQAQTALGEKDKALASYRAAFRAVEQHVEMNPDDARALTMGAVALCRLGARDKGLEWVERALQADPSDAGIQYNAACLFALEEQNGRAIECLQAAALAGFAHHDWVLRDPDLDSLREDPRFQAIKWRESSS